MPAVFPPPTDVTGFLTPERTGTLEYLVTNGLPLHGSCPHPACSRVDDVTMEERSLGDVIVVQFHPCEHKFWPRWEVNTRRPSRFLEEPVSRPQRRWRFKTW